MVETMNNGNGTTNTTSSPHPFGIEIVVPLATILCIIIVLSIVGNSLVILTIRRHKGMRTRTNMFITNLAISDLLTAIIDMPFSLITLIKGEWIFPEAVCEFNGFTLYLFLMTSIHTLMYISIHKCVSITRPFSRFMTPRRILYMIMATWLWSLSYATAGILGWNRSIYKPGTTQCGPSYPDTVLKKSHSLVNTVFNFIIPFLILSICYGLMFIEIRKHMDRMRETSNMDSQNSVMQQKRIAVTLFMVMACFLFCITPYIVYSSTIAFSKDNNNVPNILNPLGYWFIYANSACNPIIYAFRSPSFRQGYKEIMCGRAVYIMSGVIRTTKEQIKSAVCPKVQVNGSPQTIAGQLAQIIENSPKLICHDEQIVVTLPPDQNQADDVGQVEIIVTENADLDEDLEDDGKVHIKIPDAEEAAEADETTDLFYDSDVEMDDHSHQRRHRQPRKRRQSKSMFVPGGICRQLVDAQTKLMDFEKVTSERTNISRARSFSDVMSQANAAEKESPAGKTREAPHPFIWQPSVDRLDIPRLKRKLASRSAGNLVDLDESPSMVKKLSAFFSRSKDRSMEKLSKAESLEKLGQ